MKDFVRYGIQHKIVSPLSGAMGYVDNIIDGFVSQEDERDCFVKVRDMIQEAIDVAMKELPSE